MPPRGDVGAVSFVRADIRNPVIAKVIAKEDVDTVVHMSVIATPGRAGGRNTMKELNVIGTMQLLAACQKAETVQRLVVKSTSTAYGASNRDPAMFSEDMRPRRLPSTGYAKDVNDIEGYVRGFARRRPDVSVTMLRPANVVGAHVNSPLTSYFRLPVIPTVLGFDPRMQFLHESDLIRLMVHSVHADRHGTFNVAGDGILMLSQAIRRLGRPSVAMPGFAVGSLGTALKRARMADFSPEQIAFLTFGRGVDTTRMRTVLEFEPEFTTEQAFAEFARDFVPADRYTERLLAPSSSQEALGGDAEIIPLGTRGRPGRGSGRARPSSSSRTLAAAPRRSTSSAKQAAAKKAAPKKVAATTAPKATPAPAKTPARKAAPPKKKAAVAPQVAVAPERAATRAEDRLPTQGIPAADWVAAISAGAREVFGEQWEPRLAEFLAFLRRRITGDYVVDEYGFDADLTQRLLSAVIRPIAATWFRVEVRGLDNIPETGGALVVSNHSGTVPVDGLVTMSTIHEHTGRFLRPLGADLVFRLPVVGRSARSSGATLACQEDAERMLRGGELVGVWPEGFKGIGKPWPERYKLQRFGRGGFVSAALRTGVPIVPLSVVGAEEIYPLVGNLPSLARLLGIPYIPITPFFPLLGPLGLVPLPSKWILEFGEPIRTDEFDEGASDDPMLVFDVTDQVRESIQQTLYQLLRSRNGVFSR